MCVRGVSVNLIILVSFILLVAALSGCSSSPSIDEKEEFKAPLVWPLPPQKPRVAYERTISRPDDVYAKKGIFRRLVDVIFGQDERRVIKPYGVTVDGTGRLIVADTALKRVHIFDIKGEKYRWYEEVGRDNLVSPIGVAADAEDNIYISDSELKKVFVLNREGKFLTSIDGGFKRPTGIAVDRSRGRLYVVDTWGHDVRAYDLKDGYLFTIGRRGAEEGMFNYPTDIFLDRGGNIYITDSMNFRVQVFASDGTFLSMFGRNGDGTGDFARPKGIGVDTEGHIYVADALFDSIQIFDREGKYLLRFGGTGQGRGRFWLPTGVYIDGENMIYVADSYNSRVQVFRYLGEKGGG